MLYIPLEAAMQQLFSDQLANQWSLSGGGGGGGGGGH